MGVHSAATTGASRNRIGACIRGPASWTDLAVYVVRGSNRFIPPLAGAASRSACVSSIYNRQAGDREQCYRVAILLRLTV